MNRKSEEDIARIWVNETMTIPAVRILSEKICKYDEALFLHCQNVGFITAQVCLKMGLKKEKAIRIITGALIHDVGKICIDNSLLNKKGVLSELEFAEIKRHPEYGVGIIKCYELPIDVYNIVRNHHEKTDGSGYPDHIKSLTLGVKIVSAVDAYDALTAQRPYGFVHSDKDAIIQLCEEGTFEKDTIYILKSCLAI